MNPEDFIFIYCPTPNKQTSRSLAKNLLSLKLIACANIFPEMDSFYEWKQEFKEEKESLLICKTKKSLYQKVQRAIKKEHPYECPCIVALPFTLANPNFLQFLKDHSS